LKALPETVDNAYVTGCDVPLLVLDFVRRMIELLADHDIAVMEIDGFLIRCRQVYRRNTRPHVEALLAQNRLRPVFLFDAVRNAPRAAGGDDLRGSGTADAANLNTGKTISRRCRSPASSRLLKKPTT
jgi:molybdopterin-guanine dinucleotide biosynthesis protein A